MMKLRKTFFPIACVALLTMTSCTWDSVSRAQAYQLLTDIVSVRGEDFRITQPTDNAMSVTYKKAYYEEGKVNKTQEEIIYYITPYRISQPTIYIKHRKGEGLTTTYYKEEVHYIKNNIYYARSKTDESVDVWKCEENTSNVDSAFLATHSITFLAIEALINRCDKPSDYAEYINILDDIYTSPDITVEEDYRSTSYGSLTAKINLYKSLLDGKKELYTKFMFDYSDNLFHSLSYENLLDADKTVVDIDVDYNSFSSIPTDDLVCEFVLEDNGDVPPFSEE